MKLINLLLLFVVIIACNDPIVNHHQRHCNIHCYQTGTGDDLLYWYLLMGQNNHYYYYSSSTPVNNFNSISWATSSSMPNELQNVQETEQIEEPLSELPNEIEVEMEANTSEAETGNSNTESTSESSSESSSDGGSSSSDSGGGDGGGGGD